MNVFGKFSGIFKLNNFPFDTQELNITLQNDYEEKNINEEIIKEMMENDSPLEKKHFRNVHLFNVDSLTNNILDHRLVPKHDVIRDHKSIEKI